MFVCVWASAAFLAFLFGCWFLSAGVIRTSGLGKCISTLRCRLFVFDLPPRPVQTRPFSLNS